MPSRNVIKEFAPDQYYHLYNRGVEKRDIFLDDQDYTVFLGLLKKYLERRTQGDDQKTSFTPLDSGVKLLAYCLMPNHFHLLLYQEDADGISKLIRRVMTGYVMYFNNRHQRVGGLFQGRYKASLVNKDAYLQHVSRYIHLNPDDYNSWAYSSLPYYKGEKHAAWLSERPVLGMFNNNRQEYLEFVNDYEASKNELSVLKWQLADGFEL